MTITQTGLSIETYIDQITEAISSQGQAIVSAPPGSGKTTVVPLRILEDGWDTSQKIVMLEPRRLAARAACERMASLTGTEPGELIGYVTRDRKRTGPDVVIEVVTEGILNRRLKSDPRLSGVGMIIFDEVHERNLQTDLAWALVNDVREHLRPDLKLLMMSATINPGDFTFPNSGPIPVIEDDTTPHPTEIIWKPLGEDRSKLPNHMAHLVNKALEMHEGDILVFLPGMAEIIRTANRLQQIGVVAEVRMLHGSLPAEEQDKALAPVDPPFRKVVLSTDIAESSLTVEGVRVVIDSGMARSPRFDHRTGMTRLKTVTISRSSAEQRAGRAGRLGPGTVYRLWSKTEHAARRRGHRPELMQVELGSLALELAQWKKVRTAHPEWSRTVSPNGQATEDFPTPNLDSAVTEPQTTTPLTGESPSPEPPTPEPDATEPDIQASEENEPDTPDPQVSATDNSETAESETAATESKTTSPNPQTAISANGEGGFFANGGEILPGLTWWDNPPARAMEEAHKLLISLNAIDEVGEITEVGEQMLRLPLHPRLAHMVIQAGPHQLLACQMAAIIDQRDMFNVPVDNRPTDIVTRLRMLNSPSRTSAATNQKGIDRVRRTALDLYDRLDLKAGVIELDKCGQVLALAYPDRLAMLRGTAGRFQMMAGTTAWMSAKDTLSGAKFLVVADLDGKRKDTRIRLAAEIDPEDVEEIYSSQVFTQSELYWEENELWELVTKRIGGIALTETKSHPLPSEETTKAIAKRLRSNQLVDLEWSPQDEVLLERVRFLHQKNEEDWPNWSKTNLAETVDDWLFPAVPLLTGLDSMQGLVLGEVLKGTLTTSQAQAIDRLAPTKITLANGMEAELEYGSGQPMISLPAQSLYGISVHPQLNEEPIAVHILSPAKRSVQTTSDLPRFWSGSWQQVRKVMAGRYPKHSWPENPESAPPNSL